MSDGLDPVAVYGAVLGTLLARFAIVREWQARRSRLLVTGDEEVWHDGTMYDEYYVVRAINLSDRPTTRHPRMRRWVM